MLINELFYSLQGEGYHTGRPAVFIRFSGCNLRCPFCDTQHQSGREMSEAEIVAAASAFPARFAVLTGGEPSLFVTERLVEKLHEAGFFVAVETNGTHALPASIDWVTLSPKDAFTGAAGRLQLNCCNELKVVFTDAADFTPYENIRAEHRFVQPCDTGDDERNSLILKAATAYCLAHPTWRLSLQTHKIIGVR